MKLPNSAKEALARVFYDLGQSPEAIDDLMSVLKIFDFRWDVKNQVLIDDNTEKVFPKKKVEKDSPWRIIPIKNLSNFDLDCLERVLNTRTMKKIVSPLGLNPLFECLGWTIKLSGDTYRLHFVGGTDYWESHDPNQWNKEWTEGWQEPWIPDSIKNPWVGEADTLKIVRLQYPRINWDTDKKIPEEWT